MHVLCVVVMIKFSTIFACMCVCVCVSMYDLFPGCTIVRCGWIVHGYTSEGLRFGRVYDWLTTKDESCTNRLLIASYGKSICCVFVVVVVVEYDYKTTMLGSVVFYGANANLLCSSSTEIWSRSEMSDDMRGSLLPKRMVCFRFLYPLRDFLTAASTSMSEIRLSICLCVCLCACVCKR